MSRVKDDNYFVVQGFMVNELKLKGNELLIYAIIHGFSQTENQVFSGSLQYLADWTNSTKQGVIKCLRSLQEKELIGKNEKYINGVKFCEYYVTKFNRVLNSVEQGMQQSLIGGIKQSLPNNISINNIEDNIYISFNSDEAFKIFWNEYIKKVGKAEAEKKFKKVCTNEATFNQIIEALRKQNQEVFSKREKQYIPNASTWLNQRRWEDEVIAEKPSNANIIIDMPEYIRDQIEGKETHSRPASKELLDEIRAMQKKMY